MNAPNLLIFYLKSRLGLLKQVREEVSFTDGIIVEGKLHTRGKRKSRLYSLP
jgi:hypothetical protein